MNITIRSAALAAAPAAMLLGSGSASALTDSQRVNAANKVDTDHDGRLLPADVRGGLGAALAISGS